MVTHNSKSDLPLKVRSSKHNDALGTGYVTKSCCIKIGHVINVCHSLGGARSDAARRNAAALGNYYLYAQV